MIADCGLACTQRIQSAIRNRKSEIGSLGANTPVHSNGRIPGDVYFANPGGSGRSSGMIFGGCCASGSHHPGFAEQQQARLLVSIIAFVG